MPMNCILTVAGSDSSAAAGIQADVKAVAANGGHCLTVLTAVTAQTADGVLATMPVPAEVVTAQLRAVASGFRIAAAKSGMLANSECVDALASAFRSSRPSHYVIDPVIVSTSGHMLLTPAGVDAMVSDLFPLAALVTPNIGEAERLSGRSIASVADAQAAGETILRLGCGAVLVKGGHLAAAPATDLLIHAGGTHVFEGDFIAGAEARGTGCTLSAAIATLLGRGETLVDAIAAAKAYVEQAIRHASAAENRLLDHFHAMREP